ncbi:MAG: helix-turn-helix domain-containing protein [Candidatus Moranbacteria bacterium]|nr:helix-turn-helix domain-containing protein [Candidatus Moranbacteria bacterium]
MNIQQTLNNYGLTAEEANLYLAGLKTGEAPLARIAKMAGIKRPTAYLIAKSLEGKGLLGSFKMRSGLRFVVSPPSTFEQNLKRKLKEVSEILPELAAIEKGSQIKPKITLYEGEEGYYTALEDSLGTTNGVIRAIGSLKKIYEVITPEYDVNHYIPTRVKNRTVYRGLHFKDEAENIFTPERNSKEMREVKFLPEKYHHSDFILIYRNAVTICTSKKELITLKIESEEIAEAEKRKFDLIWDLIK